MRMWYEKIEQEYGTIRIEYEIEIISITTIENNAFNGCNNLFEIKRG